MRAGACARQSRAPPLIEPPGYARHRPETTLLYRLIEQHYPDFRELRAREGRSLPAYVQEKRVFGVEIDTCAGCGGTFRVIASIEEAEVIAKILAHLEKVAPDRHSAQLPLEPRQRPHSKTRYRAAVRWWRAHRCLGHRFRGESREAKQPYRGDVSRGTARMAAFANGSMTR